MSKTSVPKHIFCVALGLLAMLVFQPIVQADGPTTTPSTMPTAGPEELQKAMDDYTAATTELHKYVHSMDDFFDPAKVKASAANEIPLLRKIRADLLLISQVQPDAREGIVQLQAILVFIGDDQTGAELKQTAAGTSTDALDAKLSLVLVDWWKASKDPAAQTKVVGDYQKLVQVNNTEMLCVVTGMNMLEQGAASQDQTDAVLKILTDDVKNPIGPQAAAQYKAEKEADAKLAALENKPMTISGKQPDGTAFSTDSWKGKVILVDFWATWCGPCLEELPRVTKAYSDFHGNGLEILGVSNDYVPGDLTKFLADHKDMPWTQLFDPAAASNQKWNPITEGFGITGIPTMFLIDKKGVCRTVSARENLEDLIPKLLAE